MFSDNHQLFLQCDNGVFSMNGPVIIFILAGLYMIFYVIGGVAALIRLSIFVYEKIYKLIKK